MLFRSLDLDVDGRKLSLGHKQTKANPWDKYEKDFNVNTIHKSTISEIIDKGAIIELNDDISAFCPSSHLEKDDGSILSKGDEAEFKVIEFSKEFKRVVLSHTLTYKNDSSFDDPDENNLKDDELESNDK